MISAVDTSVLLTIFKDEPLAPRCLDLLEQGARAGELVICDVVAAEVGALFTTFAQFEKILLPLGVRYDAITDQAAYLAGRIFQNYGAAGGPREHLIPDFLIGAHALKQADRLVAIDRGYLRSYFKTLIVATP